MRWRGVEAGITLMQTRNGRFQAAINLPIALVAASQEDDGVPVEWMLVEPGAGLATAYKSVHGSWRKTQEDGWNQRGEALAGK